MLRSAALLLLLITITVLAIPLTKTDAQVVNKDCLPRFDTKCFCGFKQDKNGNCTVKDPSNKRLCSCQETTNGFLAKGECTAKGICTVKQASDSKGGMSGLGNMGDFMKNIGGIGQLLSGLGSMMGAMKKDGGSGSGSGTGQGVGANYSGCVQYYPTSNASNTDPCAYYAPTASSGIDAGAGIDAGVVAEEGVNASKGLLDALAGLGGEQPGSEIATIDDEGSGGDKEPAAEEEVTVGSFKGGDMTGLQPGVRGDIRQIPGGVTVLVGSRDIEQNKEVAGFYGSQATQGQATTLIGTWCQSRPWASNFLRLIIPPTFFDSLCTARGYQVGAAAPTSGAPKVTVTQTKATTKTFTAELPKATTTKKIIADVDAKVDIWAVPAKVSLGARTTVFWNAKGVDSCQITSPDGSFTHETLSGGAATVPLTSATTYSISCLKADGKPVTNYVTVDLKN